MIVKNSNGDLILSVEDWFAHASPKKGSNQWKDYRSAKELAKSWFRPNMPDELRNLLNSNPAFQGFVIDEAVPEYQIQLDRFGGEPRNADLLILGRCNDGPGWLTIEAKADEEFRPVECEYHREKSNSKSNVPKRINNLVQAMFGKDSMDEKLGKLRYQLLHGAAATLIEAKKRKVKRAAFIIHEFLSSKTDPAKVLRNTNDWDYFCSLYGMKGAIGTLSGPFEVAGGEFVQSNIPLFIGKASIALD
jgi:hypothetical protein